MSKTKRRTSTRKQWYVGRTANTTSWAKGEPFSYATTPTEASHGKRYVSVLGPFRTKRAAIFASERLGSPTLVHVRDYEDAERRERERAMSAAATTKLVSATGDTLTYPDNIIKRIVRARGLKPSWTPQRGWHDNPGSGVPTPDWEFAILGFYSGAWEEVHAEETREAARQQLRAYRENEPGTAFRLRRQRVTGPTQNPRRMIRMLVPPIVEKEIYGIDHAEQPIRSHKATIVYVDGRRVTGDIGRSIDGMTISEVEAMIKGTGPAISNPPVSEVLVQDAHGAWHWAGEEVGNVGNDFAAALVTGPGMDGGDETMGDVEGPGFYMLLLDVTVQEFGQAPTTKSYITITDSQGFHYEEAYNTAARARRAWAKIEQDVGGFYGDDDPQVNASRRRANARGRFSNFMRGVRAPRRNPSAPPGVEVKAVDYKGRVYRDFYPAKGTHDGPGWYVFGKNEGYGGMLRSLVARPDVPARRYPKWNVKVRPGWRTRAEAQVVADALNAQAEASAAEGSRYP